jgi:hypothetical protein
LLELISLEKIKRKKKKERKKERKKEKESSAVLGS